VSGKVDAAAQDTFPGAFCEGHARPLRDPVSGTTIHFRWAAHGDYPDGRPAHRWGTIVHVRTLLGFTQKRLDYWRESPRRSRAAARRDAASEVYSADLLERKASFAHLRVGPDKYDLWAAWDFKLDVLDYVDSEEVERKRDASRRARLEAWEDELLKGSGEVRMDPRSVAFVFFDGSSISPDFQRAKATYDRKDAW
jgi:hypothetical protein